MRGVFPVVFIILIIALLVCAVLARRSVRSIGKDVALLCGALVPPVAGNLIIILSESPILSTVGCFLYFIGMNYVMFALLRYTFAYCQIPKEKWRYLWIAYSLLILDTISLLLNNVFHHAFVLEQIDVGGEVYYRFVPLLGQTFHRIVDYGIFFAVLVIFFVKMIRSGRLLLERYAIIFITMIVVGIWQTFYIFSRTPIDRSMIGFGVFGLLVFGFSIFYRPMRLLDRMLVTMASELQDALLFFDLNRNCIWANEKGLELAGVTEKELEQIPGKLMALFGPPREKETAEDWNEQKEIKVGDETRYYLVRKKTVFDARQRMAGSFLNIRDNTQEKAELRIERYNATHDPTTGLYNREYIYQRIREILNQDPEGPWLIIVANIDEFEVITDVYGTAFGEMALRQIAQWLGVDMPDGSVYGRLGGTEFGALVPLNKADFRHLQNDLAHSIVRADSVEQHIFVHFGVYRVIDPNLEISVMFDRARLALSNVRDNLKQYVGFYEETLKDRILWNHQISAQLPEALEKHQLIPYLQPIMDASGRLEGAEVLCRWLHPTEGFLTPDKFIPVFEKNGLIAEVDRYMWRCACEILAGWKRDKKDLFLSVNISPRDFDVMNVVAEIKGLVNEYKVSSSRLRLEITETMMGAEQSGRIRVLNELRAEGFMIEMDDFGSGYSSMNLLKEMPVDLVKLDMGFLRKAEDVERATIIIQTIIEMTRQLGILSLMEGVETDRQYQILANMGCQYFQGFYFSRPLPADQFEERVSVAESTTKE